MSDNKISIVFSTRKIDERYLDHIRKTCLCADAEILPYENNGEYSLTEIYNKGLAEAKNDIIIFCHDDLIFETRHWGKKMANHFANNPDYGIIGIAGTNRLIDGRWWAIREAMHGIVNHSDGIRKWTSMFSKDQGSQIKRMVALDGLFFAVDRTKLKHNFDNEFNGFHFYDLSFCIPNHLDGVKIGLVTDITVTHLSIGVTNQKWEDNKKLLEKKYAGKFPMVV
jgi:hypothetical protein